MSERVLTFPMCLLRSVRLWLCAVIPVTSNTLSALNCLQSVSSVFIILILLSEQITKQMMEILTEHTAPCRGKGITLFSVQRSNSAILDEVNSIFQ